MSKKLLYFLLFVPLLISCAGGQFTGGEPEERSEVVIMGNPPSTLPVPPAQLVEKSLEGHPYWEGSAPSSGPFENIYLIRFDTAKGTASLASMEDPDVKSTGFTILDDGTIETADKTVINLTISINSASSLYPVGITLVTSEQSAGARLFAVDVKDESFLSGFGNINKACADSPAKYYDADALLFGNANSSNFVAGFVLTRDEKGNECSLRVHDHCVEEGKMLADIVGNEKSPFGYSVRYVPCDCRNGKCMESPSDQPMAADEKDIDICKASGKICASIFTEKSKAGQQILQQIGPMDNINIPGSPVQQLWKSKGFRPIIPDNLKP